MQRKGGMKIGVNDNIGLENFDVSNNAKNKIETKRYFEKNILK